MPASYFASVHRDWVPEEKSVKNRVHLDIWTTDLRADIDRLVAVGAIAIGEITDPDDGPFQIMQDPEGNEFCLVT
jgi:predicted enzyme related to lactoylglutathione lyase